VGVLAAALRQAGARGRHVRAALGMVVFAGGIVAALGVLAFAWLATFVRGGRTQAADEAVLRWMGAHRVPWLEVAALEVTFLGNGIVVVCVAGVAALFLGLLRQRTAAWLLAWSTVGGLVLNSVLKSVFHRPRPQLFAWGAHVLTTSFPSGHAMSAAAVYGTVALLAARFARRRAVRAAVYVVCAVVVAGVAASRMYLGVHYPSDVVAGVVIGAAWAAFCAAALEAAARGRRRRRAGDAPDPGAQAASIASSTRS
jgi:undecaprenyl-diphosphatase